MKRFFIKLGRFFWSWGFLKFILWSVTIIVFLYVEEDWRGARNWAATKTKWEVRGVSFDFNTYLPPPVPDDQNFAAIPLFKMEPDALQRGNLAPLALNRAFAGNYNAETDSHPITSGDWQHGKTTDMAKFRQAVAAEYSATFPGRPLPNDLMEQFRALYPVLELLRTANAARPFCRFEQNYKFDPPYENYLGLITAQIMVSKFLTYDAVAALDAHNAERAWDDIRVNDKLVGGMMDQPIFVSGLVSIGMVAINLGSVYDGLSWHSWNDAQLAQIQRELSRIDFLTDYRRMMRGETIGVMIPAIDRIKSEWSVWLPDKNTGKEYKDSFPSLWANGWIDQWKVRSVDLNLTASTWVNPEARLFLPKAMEDYQAATERKLNGWTIYLPWNWLFRMGVTGPIFNASGKFAQMQVWVDEARIACALERYRLAHGAYPSTLDALVSAYIDELPHDIMNGEPYHYSLKTDGTFLLYSVGWNQVDDGGKEVDEPGTTHRDYTKGDWVWPTPRTPNTP
jgi:hypothetical protein